jgi:hypothetical protein
MGTATPIAAQFAMTVDQLREAILNVPSRADITTAATELRTPLRRANKLRTMMACEPRLASYFEETYPTIKGVIAIPITATGKLLSISPADTITLIVGFSPDLSGWATALVMLEPVPISDIRAMRKTPWIRAQAPTAESEATSTDNRNKTKVATPLAKEAEMPAIEARRRLCWRCLKEVT